EEPENSFWAKSQLYAALQSIGSNVRQHIEDADRSTSEVKIVDSVVDRLKHLSSQGVVSRLVRASGSDAMRAKKSWRTWLQGWWRKCFGGSVESLLDLSAEMELLFKEVRKRQYGY